MADTNEMALARIVYTDLCSALDKRGWHYTPHEEDLVVTFRFNGDDIPMDFIVIVDADRQLIRLFSRLPFTVPEDKRVELAIATCAATYSLTDGSFDYDIQEGIINFRLTVSFRESRIGDSLFEYLVAVSNITVDEYNDQFFAISKGVLSVEDFLKKVYN